MPRGSLDQLSDPETASASSPLLELPTELLVMILEYLPLRDLTKMCLVLNFYQGSVDTCVSGLPQVCHQLNGIVNSEHFTSLWTKASLEQLWPSQNNTHIIHKLVLHWCKRYNNLATFLRAAKHGNTEALIKLSVAYLYSEGGWLVLHL